MAVVSLRKTRGTRCSHRSVLAVVVVLLLLPAAATAAPSTATLSSSAGQITVQADESCTPDGACNEVRAPYHPPASSPCLSVKPGQFVTFSWADPLKKARADTEDVPLLPASRPSGASAYQFMVPWEPGEYAFEIWAYSTDGSFSRFAARLCAPSHMGPPPITFTIGARQLHLKLVYCQRCAGRLGKQQSGPSNGSLPCVAVPRQGLTLRVSTVMQLGGDGTTWQPFTAFPMGLRFRNTDGDVDKRFVLTVTRPNTHALVEFEFSWGGYGDAHYWVEFCPG